MKPRQIFDFLEKNWVFAKQKGIYLPINKLCQINQQCIHLIRVLQNKAGHKPRLFEEYIVFGLFGVLLCRYLNLNL
jgi:hypothetical protein